MTFIPHVNFYQVREKHAGLTTEQFCQEKGIAQADILEKENSKSNILELREMIAYRNPQCSNYCV